MQKNITMEQKIFNDFKHKKINKKAIFAQLFGIFDHKDWIKAIGAIIFISISAVSDLLIPFFFSKILGSISADTFAGGRLDATTIPWEFLGVMGGLALIAITMNSLAVFLSTNVAINTSAKLRTMAFGRSQFLSAIDMDKVGHSSIITRITSDATQIELFLLNFNTLAIKAVAFVIGGFLLSIIQLAIFNADNPGSETIWFSTLAYAFIFIFFGIAGILMAKSFPIFGETRKAVDTNNTIMNENIVGNKLIRVFNLEKNQSEKYRQGNDNLRKFSIKSDNLLAGLMPIAIFFINLATLTILAFAGTYAWTSSTDPLAMKHTASLIGVIMSFIQYLAMIMLGMILLSQFGYMFSRGKVCGKRIFDLINYEPSIQDAKTPSKFEDGPIQFNKVSFAYNKDDNGDCKYVLRDINLMIPTNSSLGIIGQTGSGKSTLVSLISRLYDAVDGTITINDKNIQDISITDIHNNIAVSLQEKVLVHGTIKSNILIGKPHATEDEIIDAVKNAGAWEFISKKDEQLNSVVEQRGVNLSGGQKQRISIARALIKKPKILIFDDSTSALDTITERNILENLEKNFSNTTKIFVSQKVNSIKECDDIIVLDDGKIVQQGTHTELMQNEDGIYKKIYDSQNTSIEG